MNIKSMSCYRAESTSGFAGATLRLTAALFLAAVISFAGCSPTPEPDETATAAAAYQADESLRTLAADPAGAIKAVYSTLEEYRSSRLEAETAAETVGLDYAEIDDAYVYVSDVKYGLCDIIILKPADGSREDIKESLYRYKERKIREFENYDILGAYAIAQNAIVYDQGDFIVLLMLTDNDAAKAIIDEYIPQ